MFGLSVAITTPFTKQGEIDFESFRQHINVLMHDGVNSVTFFGTTGEGPSISLDEKLHVLSYLYPKYYNQRHAILAIICSSSADAITEIKNYNNLGFNKFLIAPPYFFGEPSNRGLCEWFSEIFSTSFQFKNQFILYNIPQITGVTIENDLISELRQKFGNQLIYGIKDSSGDMARAESYLTNEGLMVAIGDERLIADSVSLGASGSICGLSNIFPKQILRMIHSNRKSAKLNALIDEILKNPVTPGVKAVLAIKTQNEKWLNVRPPLIEAPKEQINCLKDIMGISS